MLKILEQRLRNITKKQKILLIAATFIATLWLYLTFFLLEAEKTDFLSTLQIDKIIHFSGGIAAAGILFIFFNISPPIKLILSVLLIGLVWELWEFTLPPHLEMFQKNFYVWFFDSLADLTLDILGAYLWIKVKKIPQLNTKLRDRKI